jgi:hypothetical protein
VLVYLLSNAKRDAAAYGLLFTADAFAGKIEETCRRERFSILLISKNQQHDVWPIMPVELP